MKKILLLLATVLCTLLLAGCSNIDDYLGNQMLKKSSVLEETNYVVYEQFASEGKLDHEGLYIEATNPIEEEHASIHLTFAENSNLQIRYYTDTAHLIVLDQDECYLNPGDSLYAVVKVNDEIFSSMYEFAGFKVFEINEQGERKETTSVKVTGQSPDFVLSIPPAFDGKELSIIPVGSYQSRDISLNAFCSDDNGNMSEVFGAWYINEKEIEEKSVSISAVSSYIISFKYDSDSYFFVSSEPECYYSNNADGIVIFKQRDPTDETIDYSVNLHEYLDVVLVSDMDRHIGINDGAMKAYAANSEVTISKLRYGQKVILTTNKEWPALEFNRDLFLRSSSYDSETRNYKYELIVPEKGSEFLFDPSEYQYEHGTIVFKCFGAVVNSPQMLAKGTRIFYSQGSAETGYWLAPGDNLVIVGEESETRKQLQDIHFTPRVQVAVALEQPEYGGSVIYSADGNRIYTDTYTTYSGTAIEMEFKIWPGWVLDDKAHDKDVYTVNDNRSQIVKGPGYDIKSVFSEALSHKPKLTVTLNESVGDMKFSIEASGFKSGACGYTSAFLSSNSTVVDEQIIGTEIPIDITIGNRALEVNKAVRFVMTKTDSLGNETAETRYVTDMSARLDPFYIYTESELGKSTTTYKSVSISISIVDIKTFSQPTALSHATISVRNMLTNKIMSGGELIEGSEKVTVKIYPEQGYYISGKNVTGDVYQETMKYSDYLEKLSDIIKEHPAEKYLTITLDKSDAFATYTYKLDGNEVSGTIIVKKGQELSLYYKITNSEYQLAEGAGGFLGMWESYVEVTKEIEITSEMDGKTITKSDFGISVVKGG